MRRRMRGYTGMTYKNTQQYGEANMSVGNTHDVFDCSISILFRRVLVYPDPRRNVFPGAIEVLIKPAVFRLE